MAKSSARERLRQSLQGSAAELPPVGARTAAIALILVEVEAFFSALLIERATRAGDPWSGHMALPGGHSEATDASLSATAERETLEEVGLDLRHEAEAVGRLSDTAPFRGVPVAVRPFVYLLQQAPTLSLSSEVSQALWVPLAPLQNGERRTTHRFARAGQEREFPAWDIDGHIVWGLTYGVLDEFFRRFEGLSGGR
jgi:8-oxo-dGTP pyrophosphatase MutT (NUDIX family)